MIKPIITAELGENDLKGTSIAERGENATSPRSLGIWPSLGG